MSEHILFLTGKLAEKQLHNILRKNAAEIHLYRASAGA